MELHPESGVAPVGAASTGDARVDAVLARLSQDESLTLPARLELLSDLQASLGSILDDPTPATEATSAPA